MSQDDLAASRRRHKAMTQLAVSETLRSYQRDWFQGLRRRVIDEGQPYAITSPVVPHEILDALDIPYVTNAWYSGLVAARRQSARFSGVLGRNGFHSDLDRYGSLAFGVVLDEDEDDKPWGGLPRASLVVSNSSDRASRVLADHWGAPHVGLEYPAMRVMHPNWWEMSRWNWEDLDETARIDMVESQLEAFVAVAERVAGRKLDHDRLGEIVARVNQQELFFDDVRTIICEAPKLPVRLGEVMSQVMGIQWHRGTQWALDQARAFRDEVKARADNEQWVCPNERHRFMFVGAGIWQRLDFFAEFEESHGVVFARSNYLSIASDGYLRFGGSPLRALASRYATMNRQMHIPPMARAWASWEARRHRINAALQLGRGIGTRFIARDLEDNGVPVLQLPVDPVDATKWDDAVVRDLMTRFIEDTLEASQ